jgi:hypothetical protein
MKNKNRNEQTVLHCVARTTAATPPRDIISRNVGSKSGPVSSVRTILPLICKQHKIGPGQSTAKKSFDNVLQILTYQNNRLLVMLGSLKLEEEKCQNIKNKK